jgi:hypothetical protein
MAQPQLAGVAHLDLMQYFEASPRENTGMELTANPTLAHSALLMRTSAHIRDGGVAGRMHTAYTLRLPLVDPKCSAADIVNGDAAPAVAGESEYVQVKLEAADISQVEEAFWHQLVALVDWDHSGTLDKGEFVALMSGVLDDGDAAADGTIESVWQEAVREAGGGGDDDSAHVTPMTLAKVRNRHPRRSSYCM